MGGVIEESRDVEQEWAELAQAEHKDIVEKYAYLGRRYTVNTPLTVVDITPTEITIPRICRGCGAKIESIDQRVKYCNKCRETPGWTRTKVSIGPEDGFLYLDAVSVQQDVSRSTLYFMVRTKRIPGARQGSGRRWLIPANWKYERLREKAAGKRKNDVKEWAESFPRHQRAAARRREIEVENEVYIPPSEVKVATQELEKKSVARPSRIKNLFGGREVCQKCGVALPIKRPDRCPYCNYPTKAASREV